MGIIIHKALIITGFEIDKMIYEQDHFTNAYEKAKDLFLSDERGVKVSLVSGIVDSAINQYKSFMVAPDGSKESWATSAYFDEKTREFIAYLKSDKCTFGDKSSALQWVLVEYGDTGCQIIESNCKDLYS